MDEEHPKNFFEVNTWLMKLCGLYLPQSSDGNLRTAFYYLYNAFWILYCQFYYLSSETLALIDTVKKPSDLIEHIGMLTTHLVGTYKIVILHRNRAKIEKLKRILQDDALKYETLPDFDTEVSVKANMKVFYINALTFFTVANLVPLSKFFETVYFYLNFEGDLQKSNVTCKELLPYFNKFPFDVENHCTAALLIQYFPMQFYVFQIACESFHVGSFDFYYLICNMFKGYDLQFTSLCLYIRAHFVNIRGAFRTIRARCLHKMRLPTNYQIFRDSQNPILSNMMEREMKKITIHLQIIIDVCKDMEDIFSFGTLAQSMVTLFAIVSCFYIMSYEPLFSPNFIAQLDYLGGVLIQLTFCCVYGNEITLNAQYVMIGIYESDWFGANTSFKKSMIMNMRRLQKPIVLTIGKFYPLTLTALISVIRGGFSYFTVLKQTT